MEVVIPQVEINGSMVNDFANSTVVGNREMAVVDFAVLKRLVDSLRDSDLHSIKRSIRYAIDNCTKMDELLSVMETEVQFHRTVNLIAPVPEPLQKASKMP